MEILKSRKMHDAISVISKASELYPQTTPTENFAMIILLYPPRNHQYYMYSLNTMSFLYLCTTGPRRTLDSCSNPLSCLLLPSQHYHEIPCSYSLCTIVQRREWSSPATKLPSDPRDARWQHY